MSAILIELRHFGRAYQTLVVAIVLRLLRHIRRVISSLVWSRDFVARILQGTRWTLALVLQLGQVNV